MGDGLMGDGVEVIATLHAQRGLAKRDMRYYRCDTTLHEFY